jgi:hypothetical protein
MATIRVRATGSGRIVGWRELLHGKLVDTTRLARFFMTTTLTDVITDLCALAESFDRDYRIVMIAPNGPTTACLDLKLSGVGFEIVCSRRLVRGWFPFNPFAAEFGSNYDVIVTIGGSSAEVEETVLDLLRSTYPCQETTALPPPGSRVRDSRVTRNPGDGISPRPRSET